MSKIKRIVKKDGRITKIEIDAPRDNYKVRINPENYEPIVRLAADEGRSVTKQINYMLAQQLKSKHA